MAALFSWRADRRLRLTVLVAGLLAAVAAAMAYALARADASWQVGRAATQPIPFSHAVHAGDLRLDCQFCHAQATQVAQAGMPAGEVCLGCHVRVWPVSAQFGPLSEAIASGRATPWSSVHRLPDHVRFDHGAHAAAGVTCATCHGAVETMPRTVKTATLSMGWCLDCHRDPRARGARQVGLGLKDREFAGAEIEALTRCSVCHR